jgi:hypothetical protein
MVSRTLRSGKRKPDAAARGGGDAGTDGTWQSLGRLGVRDGPFEVQVYRLEGRDHYRVECWLFDEEVPVYLNSRRALLRFLCRVGPLLNEARAGMGD